MNLKRQNSMLSRFRLQAIQFALALLGVQMAGDLTAADIVRNFQGMNYNDVAALGSSLTPPDSMGAVGQNEFVQFINGAFAIYSKTGVRQLAISDDQFWTNAGINSSVISPGLSDPRITYDPTVNRWIATEVNVTSTGNQILVGRSDTSDPSGGWKAVNYTGVAGQFADYDTLGVDATNVYIGSNNFTSSSGSFSGVSMTVIPKSDLLGSTPTLSNFKQFNQANGAMGFSPQGVTNYSTNPGHGVIFAIDLNSWNMVDRTTVNGSGASATLGTTVNITTSFDPANGPINPTQPGGTSIDGLDGRFSGTVVQVGNFIYSTDTVISGSKNAVRWLVVNESTNAIVGEGVIADSNYNFLQPSIAVNPDGTFVIAFNRVGSTAGSGNIGIYAAVGTTTGSVISVGSPFVLQEGTISNFTGPSFDTGIAKRWGDYSSTTLDPTNPNLFWTVQEIPISSTAWGTQIIAISVPEPRSMLMGAIAAIALGAWNYRRSSNRG